MGIAVGLLALGGASLGCATPASRARDDLELRKARAHFELGVDHLHGGRTALALRELMAGEVLDPKNARIHHALAEAFLRLGKLADAELHLNRVLEIHDKYHDARLMLSSIYIHQERFEEAIFQTTLLLDDPTFPGPWRALATQGWAYYRLNRRAEARRDLETGRDYNPKYWPVLLNLGILEQEEGHQVEAIENFAAVLALDPRPSANAEANYRLAEIYVSTGQRKQAIDHLVTAVAKAPTDPWGKKSEEYLKLLR